MSLEMQIRRTRNESAWRGAFAALLLQWVPVDRDSPASESTIYDRMLAARETYGLPESREEALAEIKRALNFLATRDLIAYRFGPEKGVFLLEIGAFDRALMNPKDTLLTS